MNAIQFIKENGFDKAREVVEGAPEGSTCYVFWTGKFRYINELTCEIYSEKLGGWCEANIMVLNLKNPLSELKRLVESVDVVKQLDFWGRADVGIKKAKEVIKNNTLQASYYQPSSGCYYRYGRNSLYIVRDGEWREIYGGMDSNTLIHTDSLKQAIADYESIGGEHV